MFCTNLVKVDEMKKSSILLIDGNNYAYRGYYALGNLTTSEGVAVGAIRGFFQILSTDLKVLQPDYLAVVFDKTRSERRLALYPEYKANRKEKLEGMDTQLTVIRKLLRSCGIPVFSLEGEEADDIIATIAQKFSNVGIYVLISSIDKDFAQLVDKYIYLVESKTRRILGKKEVIEKWGVKPTQIIDYLAFLGDTVDNIPGVYGVGGKNACLLLNKYGSIQGVLNNVESLTPALCKNIKQANKDGTISMAQELILLDRDVSGLKLSSKRCKISNFIADYDTIHKICRAFELKGTEKLIYGMF